MDEGKGQLHSQPREAEGRSRIFVQSISSTKVWEQRSAQLLHTSSHDTPDGTTLVRVGQS